MVKKIFIILGSIVGLMVLYIGTFATLSEMAEVVVIRTPGGEQGPLETRIWVVDTEDGMIIRGSAGKTWVEAARAATQVELQRNNEWHQYTITEQPGEEAQALINRLMREKYQFADLLGSALRDATKAVPMELKRTRK